MYQQLKLAPYAVHTTFQYAGTEGKRHRLREAMVFYDPPEYYDAPGNLWHELIICRILQDKVKSFLYFLISDCNS